MMKTETESYASHLARTIDDTLAALSRLNTGANDAVSDDETAALAMLAGDVEQARLLLDFAPPDPGEVAEYGRLRATAGRGGAHLETLAPRLRLVWTSRAHWRAECLPVVPARDADADEIIDYLQDRQALALELAAFGRYGCDTKLLDAALATLDAKARERVASWPVTTSELDDWRIHWGIDDGAPAPLAWLPLLIEARGADGSREALLDLLAEALPAGPVAPLGLPRLTAPEHMRADRALRRLGVLDPVAPSRRPSLVAAAGAAFVRPDRMAIDPLHLHRATPGETRLAAASTAVATSGQSVCEDAPAGVSVTFERDRSGHRLVALAVEARLRMSSAPALATEAGFVQPDNIGPGLWMYRLSDGLDESAVYSLELELDGARHELAFDLLAPMRGPKPER